MSRISGNRDQKQTNCFFTDDTHQLKKNYYKRQG
jgi:hypothetical protein